MARNPLGNSESIDIINSKTRAYTDRRRHHAQRGISDSCLPVPIASRGIRLTGSGREGTLKFFDHSTDNEVGGRSLVDGGHVGWPREGSRR